MGSPYRALALALVLPAARLSAAPCTSSAAEEPLGVFERQIDGFAAPADVAVTGRGADQRLWVLEEVGCRVTVVDASGARERSFGRLGSGPGELRDPRGLAIGPDGDVFVADTGNHRVVVFGADGAFRRSFGGYGSDVGELCGPVGLAVDDELVWVADTGNDRVQAFALDGTPRLAFGRTGDGDGELNAPVDVAVTAAEVAVCDRDNHRVQRFRRDGTFVTAFGDKGVHIGLFLAPTCVVSNAGRWMVADRDNHRVETFDARGRVVDDWGLHAIAPREGAGRLHYPERIALAPSGDQVVVCERFEDRVQIFGRGERPPLDIVDVRGQDPAPHYGTGIDARGILAAIPEPSRPSLLVFDLATEEAINITRVARHGRNYGELLRPTDVALHPRPALQRIVVADAGTLRLNTFELTRTPDEPLRYDPAMGRFVKALDLTLLSGEDAWNAPWPIRPSALEYDAGENLWIVDARACRVLRLDPELRIAAVLGGHGDEPGRFSRPSDVALDRAGERVYVVDAGARRVRVHHRDGDHLFDFGGPAGGPGEDGRFVRPWGIHAGRDGRVYVSDEGGHAVHVFEEDGAFVRRLGTHGLGALEFHKPRGLTQDGRGALLVLDWGNHRVQVIDPDGAFVEAFGARFFVMAAQGIPVQRR